MNFLDIVLIIIIALFILFGIMGLVVGIYNSDVDMAFGSIIGCLIGVGIFSLPFLVIDKASGTTLGTITSVDKSFFGTTDLYIKTTETKEEKYCIEYNQELENKAKELIGEKVKITYDKRIGFYSLGKCHQSPVETIETIGGAK